MKPQLMIYDLHDHIELTDQAAVWFNQKWDIPTETYRTSIIASQKDNYLPRWFVIMDEGKIVAGCGIIDNDFHQRPDLTPNICAVYVQEDYRHQGLARQLLDRACDYLQDRGFHNVYLITTHTQFYEKCGWEYYGMIKENNEHLIRMYHRKLLFQNE
jgi:GNAT superfamily N-acetyltransferase